MISGENGERSRPAWVTLAWLGAPAVAVIVFAIGWLIHGSGTSTAGERPSGAGERSSDVKGFACAFAMGADQTEADNPCDKLASEFARRSTLDDDERHQAERVRTAVQFLLADAEVNCRERPAACSATGPEPLTVDEVRQLLEAGGYRGSVVRVARDDDPAPPGTVFYAVPAGLACVLGNLGAADLASNSTVFGTLSDGTCAEE